MAWADALAAYDDLLAANHHVDIYWFPHTDVVQVKTNNRLDADPSEAEPLSRSRAWLEDELLSNTAFAGMNALGNRLPSLVPRLARLAGGLQSERRYSDVPHRVFTAPRRVVFREMEYAVPRAAGHDGAARGPGAHRPRPGGGSASRSRSGTRRPTTSRCPPRPDRESVYLAFHVNRATDHTAYFHGVEEILRAHDGRPHWGKLHTRTAADLAPAYPRWQEFADLRDRLDPDRVFTNPHLTQILGP